MMQAASRSSAANEEMMVVVLLMFCCVSMIVAAVGFYLTGQDQEGTPCKGDDENAKYERDDEGDCVYKGCKIGYAVDEDGICVFDQSGKDCEGSDPNAIYETNVSNVCSFVMCNYGYNIGEDGTCVVAEGGGGGDGGGDGDGDGDGAAPVPVNCVGEWEVYANSCDHDCGTSATGTYYYDIKTSAAHGGNACPHAQDDRKTASCDLPSCPTVDTTETIGGKTYDVKYYDDRDGHAGYYVQRQGPYWHSPTRAVWNGGDQTSTSANFGSGTEPDPIIGSDGHGYLKGTEQTTIEGTSGTYTRYSVKRSQEPMQGGTCTLNKATEYAKKVMGYSDYECAGRCEAKRSKGTCESTHEACDYVRDDVPSYEVSSRSGTALSGACKWLQDGDTQEIAPDWETKIEYSFLGGGTRKKINGTFLKQVVGRQPFYYVQANGVPLQRTPSEARDRTRITCIEQCFSDPECTGFNEVDPLNDGSTYGEYYTCDLYTGHVSFGGDGYGRKIKRNYE